MPRLSLLLLLACEPMDSPGNPFEPVEVEAPPTRMVTGETLASDQPSDEIIGESAISESEPEETVVEDVHVVADVESPNSGVVPAVVECPSIDDMQQEVWTEHLEKMEWCKLPSPDAVVAAEWGGTLKLHEIKFEDSGRPFAVLDMPNNDRRVAYVGSMLPELGVVVVGIGMDAVQIVQISPNLSQTEATVVLQTMRSGD